MRLMKLSGVGGHWRWATQVEATFAGATGTWGGGLALAQAQVALFSQRADLSWTSTRRDTKHHGNYCFSPFDFSIILVA